MSKSSIKVKVIKAYAWYKASLPFCLEPQRDICRKSAHFNLRPKVKVTTFELYLGIIGLHSSRNHIPTSKLVLYRICFKIKFRCSTRFPDESCYNKSCQKTSKLARWKGSEVKVKVREVKVLVCMERSCPNACLCQKLKLQLNWFGSYEQFFKLNAISKPKRRV